MKIVIIGATGTIGRAVVAALQGRHEIVAVSRSAGEHRADITDKASLEKAFAAIGKVDAIISAAGGAVFKPLSALSDADFEKCLHDKLMGQVNVVRVGSRYVRPERLDHDHQRRAGAGADAWRCCDQSGQRRVGRLRSSCRAGVGKSEKIRVNVVSPPWVSETLAAMKMDPASGLPAADVAKAYVKASRGMRRER